MLWRLAACKDSSVGSEKQLWCRKLQQRCSLVFLRSGATLLTRGERVAYGLAIGAIVVLVSVGVSHAAQFYASVLTHSVLGPK